MNNPEGERIDQEKPIEERIEEVTRGIEIWRDRLDSVDEEAEKRYCVEQLREPCMELATLSIDSVVPPLVDYLKDKKIVFSEHMEDAYQIAVEELFMITLDFDPRKGDYDSYVFKRLSWKVAEQLCYEYPTPKNIIRSPSVRSIVSEAWEIVEANDAKDIDVKFTDALLATLIRRRGFKFEQSRDRSISEDIREVLKEFTSAERKNLNEDFFKYKGYIYLLLINSFSYGLLHDLKGDEEPIYDPEKSLPTLYRTEELKDMLSGIFNPRELEILMELYGDPTAWEMNRAQIGEFIGTSSQRGYEIHRRMVRKAYNSRLYKVQSYATLINFTDIMEKLRELDPLHLTD